MKCLQFTDGVSLAAAAASATAEPDADDAEGAVGDAPACPLCLSSRKQVVLLSIAAIPHLPPSSRNADQVSGCMHSLWACILLAMHRGYALLCDRPVQARKYLTKFVFRVAGEKARMPALQVRAAEM